MPMYDRSFLQIARTGTPEYVTASRRRARRPALIAAWAFWTAGCAPSLGSAVHAYEHGRYPQAMEELRAVEADAGHSAGSEAARYALYRGLAHFALGNLAAARHWFSVVNRHVAADPALLSSDDAGRLASAWAHLPR